MVSVWYASSAVAPAGSRHFSYEQQWSRPPIQENGTNLHSDTSVIVGIGIVTVF